MFIFNRYILVFSLVICFANSYASHYRAGEIYYQKLNAGTRNYRATVISFTDPQSPANSFTENITLFWGDGTSEVVQRSKLVSISSSVQRNEYVADHSYSTDGVFVIHFTDPNRVDNIININGGNSENIPFYVESLLRISNSIGSNSSPVLTIPPIIDGCLDFFYIHNPGAFDADGDSIAYKLDVPKQGRNEVVPNYNDPAATDSFKLNPFTGTLYWVKPKASGFYNIAIRIEEWRNGQLVGYVIRDMQIRIRDCVNNPPSTPTVENSCVEAGDSVTFNIVSTDINVQQVTLRGFSGPFKLPISPAVLSPNPGVGISIATTKFLWKTNCRHIRVIPHRGTIEAIDNFSVPLANYATFAITVIGPAPTNIKATQKGNGFLLTWNKDFCRFANGYKIYRKIDSSFFTPTKCVTGLPGELGFTLIASLKPSTFEQTDTSFYDDNKGEGLSPLINYCYRLVAIFPPRDDDGNTIVSRSSESYASVEICNAIIRSKPIITQATVTATNAINGAIKLTWIRPDTLDTTVYKAPYKIICKRAITNNGNVTFVPFQVFNYNAFYQINDTFTFDANLNTQLNQYTYKLELQYDSAGIFTFVDESPPASSVFAIMYSTDNTNIISWIDKVPWINNAYTVYRKNPNEALFDSLTTVKEKKYADTGLINGQTYQYKIESIGFYSFLNDSILNFSQEISGTPIDTIKPCSPTLTVKPPCDVFDDFTNRLTWIPRKECADDVLKYNIYYKKFSTDNFTLIGSVDGQTFSFADNRDTLRYSIAGCYSVTGIDSFNNEGIFDNVYCVDNCPYYQIPNVFTPGDDGKNDLLNPFPYRFIDRINLKIYNRWGQLVFTTENLDINWDGKDYKSGNECSNGTYFYTCDVYEQFLKELKNNRRSGTIKLNR